MVRAVFRSVQPIYYPAEVDNLRGYTTIVHDFIPQGGLGGEFGTKSQKLEYDPVNDLIIIPSYTPKEALPEGETYPRNFAFYSPDDTSEPVATVDASDSSGGPFTEPTDAVAIQSDGETYVFLADRSPENYRILIYRLTQGTSVKNWSLFKIE